RPSPSSNALMVFMLPSPFFATLKWPRCQVPYFCPASDSSGCHCGQGYVRMESALSLLTFSGWNVGSARPALPRQVKLLIHDADRGVVVVADVKPAAHLAFGRPSVILCLYPAVEVTADRFGLGNLPGPMGSSFCGVPWCMGN